MTGEAVFVISGLYSVLLVGIFGGLIAELSRWWSIRESQSFPVYSKNYQYWLITFIMILVGGFLSVFFCGTGEMSAVSPLGIGASAPLLITTLTKGATEQPRDSTRTPSFNKMIDNRGVNAEIKTLPSIISFLRGD